MSEVEMIQALNKAMRFSKEAQTTVWAMSNGSNIKSTILPSKRDEMKAEGYWVCSIFENGYRVEA